MKTHCKHGHAIGVVGRSRNGECKACARLRRRRYRAANLEKCREYNRLDGALRRLLWRGLVERAAQPRDAHGRFAKGGW